MGTSLTWILDNVAVLVPPIVPTVGSKSSAWSKQNTHKIIHVLLINIEPSSSTIKNSAFICAALILSVWYKYCQIYWHDNFEKTYYIE